MKKVGFCKIEKINDTLQESVKKRSLNAIVFLLLLASWALYGQQAVTTVANDQIAPNVVADGAGNAIITWQDNRMNRLDIYAQRVGTTQTPFWADNGVVVPSFSGSEQTFPRLISDGAGGAILAWPEQDNNSNGFDIWMQRLDSNGNQLWPNDRVLIRFDGTDETSPIFTADGSGGVVAAWLDRRNGSLDIYAQRVNASGSRQWGDDGVAIVTASGDQAGHRIVSDGNGGAIISWIDLSVASSNIRAQRIDANGNTLWSANGEVVAPSGNLQSRLVMVSDNAGGAIFAWSEDRNSQLNIFGQRLNANGTKLWVSAGAQLSAHANTSYFPRNVMVADGNSGDAILAWMDNSSGSNTIYIAKVLSSGQVDWERIVVNLSRSQATTPSLVSDNNGGAIISWTDDTFGNFDIFAIRVNDFGSALWPYVQVTDHTSDQSSPRLAADNNGGLYVVWTDDRRGNVDVFYRYVNDAGIVGIKEIADVSLPTDYQLEQNYPNPFNPSTDIRFQLPKAGHVSIDIYNATGQKVKTLVNDTYQAGVFETTWDGKNQFDSPVSSGVYMYRITAGNFVQSKKMMLIR